MAFLDQCNKLMPFGESMLFGPYYRINLKLNDPYYLQLDEFLLTSDENCGNRLLNLVS